MASVEEVEVRHVKALMECGGEVTLDVARSILAAHFRTLRATRSAGVRRLAGGYIQCPTCSTPWMADLFRPRIAGCPRKARNERRLRRVLQRSRRQPGKLTKGDKRLLWRFEGRLNMMEVLCHVCGNKKEELFAVPDTEKVEEVVEVEKRRKKKKKRCKEVNAGLLISSRPVAGNTEESCKSVFTMSEIDTCTPEVPETTLEKSKSALDGAKSALDTRKKSLKRQKVPLGVFKPRKNVSRVEIKSVPCQPAPCPNPYC
ncbi:uncharacterized protein LOC123505636 [Portunus trituberculatus]|uniref:uncharacterized protein LOC123505636 n=1 Tax=Portunus trituberculatus TaxID=210409 RepID=UPI001E1CF422|nr:uncharacterized protein LOC123505636 [Portunus trituberculatus]